jgi:mannan endo-1,4-beta-mannosidase
MKLRLNRKTVMIICILYACTFVAQALDVTFVIDTDRENDVISPYIYGTNQLLSETENWTARRVGGNRMTGYNWETNASNAGSDWEHSSDNYMCTAVNVPSHMYETPAAVYTVVRDEDIAKGRASVFTLQMAGYVAKDKNGTVTESEVAPSIRWVQAVAKKGSSFSLNPNTGDSYVYMDELVNFLVNRYGNASSADGVRFYCLDNEPALWPSTHPRIHPDAAGCVELRDKTIALSKAIKDVDPSAETVGPVLYGFSACNDFQSASDWSSVQGSYAWFIDYYLDSMHTASNSDGRRLLDILDVHWYPEAQGGGQRIVFNGVGSDDTCRARIQAPRTLWDPSYVEDSWIGEWFSSFLPLIPRLKQSIDNYYPGTKLAITEYCYGGESHISGGIAIADVLGIMGKYGVYLASYWNIEDTTNYTSAAFKIFRNYDGNNGTYGDTKVKADTNNVTDSSIYAAKKSGDNTKLHIIVINKNWDQSLAASFAISGSVAYTSGQVWAFDSTSASITRRTAISNISGNSFSYTLPRLSVVHIVLQAGTTPTTAPAPTPGGVLPGDVNSDGKVDIVDALVVAQYYVGLNPSNFNADAADTNCNSSIDIVDALLIAQYYEGLIPGFCL